MKNLLAILFCVLSTAFLFSCEDPGEEILADDAAEEVIFDIDKTGSGDYIDDRRKD
ncbi:hypothetical protein QQ008_29540 [Fulvivirgaceae bacterium BMA10]|uniref:Secreted protein n=1 Tax=Splendidivirga corallicola TaxID=3051826 RepID=A0ABT8KXR1_9BACT|nr:hypothetical protein [Fulvivirgaceae bacterium BMA10]